MAVIQVWKCLRTGKLFESKAAYKKHRKALLPEVKQELNTARQLRKFAPIWQEISSVEQDVHQFLAVVVENQAVFWAQARATNRHEFLGYSRKLVVLPDPIVVKLEATHAQWRDSCSNTHAAPAGGVTNWGGAADKPRGYPGIVGSITLVVSVPAEFASHYHATTIFKTAKIHTGSGGGGGYGPDNRDPDRSGNVLQSYTYGFTIFAHEVIGLWKDRARYRALEDQKDMWRRVGGGAFDPSLPDDWTAPALPDLKSYYPTAEVCNVL